METYINNIINKKYNTDRGYLYFIDLLLEKYPDFQINYDNLNKLEISSITKSVFLESGFSGVYTFDDNKIRLFNNTDENGKEIFKDITISDDELINAFLHELIHAITSKEKDGIIYEGFNMRHNGQSSYFLGINEGVTQMITDDLLGEESDAYIFQTIFVRQLAEIIGKEKLVSMYSKNDIDSLADAISSIDKNFDFRGLVVDTYLFNLINSGYNIQGSEKIGTKIQESLISLNKTASKENDFDSYIIDEKKVLHLARYLPIRVLTLGDCGFEGIDSISLDNPEKLLS